MNSIARHTLARAFELWEIRFRNEPEGFMTADEVAAMEAADLAEKSAIYFEALLREVNADSNSQDTSKLAGHEGGVVASAVGVDFVPISKAPFGEVVLVKVHTENADTFNLKKFATLFSGSQPLIVGPMEFVTILTEGAKDGKTLSSEPRESDNLNLHHGLPAVAEAAIVPTSALPQEGGAA